MLLSPLILSVLAACIPGGDGGRCKANAQPFEIDRAVSLEEVLMVMHTGTSDDLECSSVCEQALEDDYSRMLRSIETCDLDMLRKVSADEYEDTGLDDSEIVAELQCTGISEDWCEGRRPLGHHEVVGRGPTPLAAALATSAHLEAASVGAFHQLAARLSAWGAPATLADRCLDAARDEEAHAASVGTLARARGGVVPPAVAEEVEAELLAMAKHNAVHGCVLEAWAAFLAHLHALLSPDAEVRATYRTIAADETRHGELAWDLHAWFLTQLGPSEQEAVHEAQHAVLADLPRIACVQATKVPAELGMLAPEKAWEAASRFSRGLAA